MLADFDATLAQLLTKRVPLDPRQIEVSFECPTKDWAARLVRPAVNLYLFDMRQNMTYGQKSGQPAGPLPPSYIDLSYFITVWAPAITTEHQLLWKVMLTLMRETTIAPDVLQGALQQTGPPVQVTTGKWDGVIKNPGELWGSLGNALKPGLTYTATLSMAMRTPPAPAKPVLTKLIVTENMQRNQRESLVAIGGIVRERAASVQEGEAAPPQRVISDAEVTFPQLGITVRSDSDGRYVVRKIPQGTHIVQVVTATGGLSEAEITIPAPNYNLEV